MDTGNLLEGSLVTLTLTVRDADPLVMSAAIVVSLSGGKDSAGMLVYLVQHYGPERLIAHYQCDFTHKFAALANLCFPATRVSLGIGGIRGEGA